MYVTEIEVTFQDERRFGDNPANDDAGTICVTRYECDEDGWPDEIYENPVLVKKTSLAEMVAYCLEGWRTLDGFTADCHVQTSDALAAALREAADMLDAGKRPGVDKD